MENIIALEGLTKTYGDFTAVDHLDLSIRKGEIFGLLGPNGAGKSTTILMMMGLTEPDQGNAKVCGIDPVRNPVEVKKKVGYLPEDVGFYNEYSGLENLVFTARLNGADRETANKKALELLKRVGLQGVEQKKAGTYSKGMRQRLGLADVLIKDPEVIILDEPTLGIDPAGIRDFLDLIVHLSREEGITVLFSSHQLHQVQQVCDRVGIFVGGKLLAEGNIQSLAGQLFSGRHVQIEGVLVPLDSITGKTGTKKSTAKKDGETGAGDMILEEMKATEMKATKMESQEMRSGEERSGEERSGGIISEEQLMVALNAYPGVLKAVINKDRLRIEASSDISAEVSRLLVESGYGIGSLSKPTYGLDEIYHQYFS